MTFQVDDFERFYKTLLITILFFFLNKHAFLVYFSKLYNRNQVTKKKITQETDK